MSFGSLWIWLEHFWHTLDTIGVTWVALHMAWKSCDVWSKFGFNSFRYDHARSCGTGGVCLIKIKKHGLYALTLPQQLRPCLAARWWKCVKFRAVRTNAYKGPHRVYMRKSIEFSIF